MSETCEYLVIVDNNVQIVKEAIKRGFPILYSQVILSNTVPTLIHIGQISTLERQTTYLYNICSQIDSQFSANKHGPSNPTQMSSQWPMIYLLVSLVAFPVTNLSLVTRNSTVPGLRRPSPTDYWSPFEPPGIISARE